MESASDTIGSMSTSSRFFAISILAVLPFSVLLAQDTTMRCLVVCAEQRKNGQCSEEKVIVNQVETVTGSFADFRDQARERARSKLKSDGTLKHFQVIKPDTYAFYFTYKTEGLKCMHALVGLAMGNTKEMARDEMNRILREAKAGDHDIVREWPDRDPKK